MLQILLDRSNGGLVYVKCNFFICCKLKVKLKYLLDYCNLWMLASFEDVKKKKDPCIIAILQGVFYVSIYFDGGDLPVSQLVKDTK